MKSEDYLRGLRDQGPADWGAAVRALRGEVGSKAATILASTFGVTRRTAERWVAKAEGRTSQSITPKPMAQVGMVAWAKNHYVAQKLRQARRVNAGSVVVAYEGIRDPRSRSIGTMPAVGVLREALDIAADLVQAGNYTDAAGKIDDGVLDAYGVPEYTLTVEDYQDGFSVD